MFVVCCKIADTCLTVVGAAASSAPAAIWAKVADGFREPKGHAPPGALSSKKHDQSGEVLGCWWYVA